MNESNQEIVNELADIMEELAAYEETQQEINLLRHALHTVFGKVDEADRAEVFTALLAALDERGIEYDKGTMH